MKKDMGAAALAKGEYIIEIRLFGRSKKYLRNLIQEISEKFSLGEMMKKIGVPHITFVGPFDTSNERKLRYEIGRIVKSYDLPEFQLDGFGKFDHGIIWKKKRIAFVNLVPSRDLEQLRLDLVEALKNLCILSPHDTEKFHYHATIAFKNIDDKFDTIWKYLKSLEKPKIRQSLVRLTILKERRILWEYDFMQKRFLSRREALSESIYAETISLLKDRKRTSVTR